MVHMPDPSQIQKNAENAALRAENLQAKINRLREEWLEKKNIRLHAPKNEESAERNLYVHTGRWKQYNAIKKERWESLMKPKGIIFDVKGILPRDLDTIRV